MKRTIRQLCFVVFAGYVLASCASRETQIETTTSAVVPERGSGVTDASDVNGGPGAQVPAAPIGHPGR